MNTLIHHWCEILRKDIKGFADPGTPIHVSSSAREISVSWSLRDKTLEERFFVDSAGDFRWHDRSADVPATYLAFLSSSTMGQFTQLSSAIRKRFSPIEHYIATKAYVSDERISNESFPSDELLNDVVGRSLDRDPGTTQLLFVKGDAGAGKTTLLEHLTSTRAHNYTTDASARHLFLYVSAQGRALSNLKDAFAAETGDLRAAFTWDAVAPLTRRGLIVPIIDGFDELLGAAGYGDAFGSLKDLLNDLEGCGVIVVSARSSFYDVEFASRHGSDTSNALYDLTPITLQGWEEKEIRTYLSKAMNVQFLDSLDESILSDLPDQDKSLLGKPFFVSRFPEYVDALKSHTFRGNLVDFLIQSYIKREASKIVDRDGRLLLPETGHRAFFEEAADLMWINESRRLSQIDLRLLAELIAEDSGLSSDAASQFVTKITSYAGFSVAQPGQFAFEHDVYFDYFLSRALRRQLQSSLKPLYLDRGVIPSEVVHAAIDTTSLAQSVIEKVLPVLDANLMHDNRRRNGGSLFAAASKILREISDREIKYLRMVNLSLGESIYRNVTFTHSAFENVDLSRAKFYECEAVDTTGYCIEISSDTWFDVAGLVPGEGLYSLRVVGRSEDIFSPQEMNEALQNIGRPEMAHAQGWVEYSEKGVMLVRLLEKVVQKYKRTNVLCVDEDPGDDRDSSKSALAGIEKNADRVRNCKGRGKTYFGQEKNLP